MGVQSDWEIFKNSLIYTVTFRVTSKFMQHSESSVLSLAVTSFLATVILQNFKKLLPSIHAKADVVTQPIIGLIMYLVEILSSAGVQMQSNLLGTYASRIFDGSTNALYVTISSLVGIVLIWLMGQTLKTPGPITD